MDKKLYSDLQKRLGKIRGTVVDLKGPVENISAVKKVRKSSKKETNVVSVSNVIEKE